MFLPKNNGGAMEGRWWMHGTWDTAEPAGTMTVALPVNSGTFPGHDAVKTLGTD